MKPRILVFTIALLASFAAAAQSTNPLNYSGRMYVEAIEIIATPRYVSYEDHAILSQQKCFNQMINWPCRTSILKASGA